MVVEGRPVVFVSVDDVVDSCDGVGVIVVGIGAVTMDDDVVVILLFEDG